MAKSTKSSGLPYRSAGRTSDGVTILAPKIKATHFSKGDLRTTMQQIRRKDASAGLEIKSAKDGARRTK